MDTCRIRLRLAFSITGILVGFSAGAVFSVHYKNYNAGLWGFCSAIAACLALYVTVAFIRRSWDSNPQRLRIFMLSGCFIQLAGVCGFVAYMVLAVSQHQSLTPYGNGFYIVCVWCFVTWKWGFLLLIYSRSFLYTYQIRDDILKIIEETKGRHSQEHTQYKTFSENDP